MHSYEQSVFRKNVSRRIIILSLCVLVGVIYLWDEVLYSRRCFCNWYLYQLLVNLIHEQSVCCSVCKTCFIFRSAHITLSYCMCWRGLPQYDINVLKSQGALVCLTSESVPKLPLWLSVYLFLFLFYEFFYYYYLY